MRGAMVSNPNETAFAEAFAQRISKADDGALPQVLRTVVTHLHGLIRELRPSAADWRKMIEFLTEVGHTTDERRQEWGLLFDLLGASALVDEINSRRPKQATPNTVRGPSFAPTRHSALPAAISRSMASASGWRFSDNCSTSTGTRSRAQRSRPGRRTPPVSTRTSNRTCSRSSICAASSKRTGRDGSTT